MGILFDALSNYQRKSEKEVPIRLVEPSSGRIVKLEITETDERLADIYMSQLASFAECINLDRSKFQVIGNTIRLEFADNDMAEIVRKKWRQ